MTEEEEIKVTIPGSGGNKPVPQRKLDYAAKLRGLLDEYDTCLVVTVDNVGSKQIAGVRKDFRGKARFLFGKNTLIRKVIREHMKETGNKKLWALLDLVKGNSGFCFTKSDVKELRKDILDRKVQCAAKAGAVAPCDVSVFPGPTGMEPTQTTFFQAMNIPTRINRGQIDITEEVRVIVKGTKVGASESSLLTKLGIRPFFYGIQVDAVYSGGTAYDAKVLDLTDDDVANFFFVGVRRVAALCFSINYPTIANVPHSLLNAYKKVLALGLGFNKYSWEKLAKVKEILENPEAFAVTSAPANTGAVAPAPVVEEEEEPEKESSAGGAADMFGGGGDDDSEEEES